MRVDILSDGERSWFSELTVYNMAGRLPGVGDNPKEGVSTSWDLRQSWFMTTPQRGWRRVYAWALKSYLGDG